MTYEELVIELKQLLKPTLELLPEYKSTVNLLDTADEHTLIVIARGIRVNPTIAPSLSQLDLAFKAAYHHKRKNFQHVDELLTWIRRYNEQ